MSNKQKWLKIQQQSEQEEPGWKREIENTGKEKKKNNSKDKKISRELIWFLNL